MKFAIRWAALCLCLVLLAGCGRTEIGEKQAFSPNITIGQSEEEQVPTEKLSTLRIPCDYTQLVTSPWNCTDLNTRKAAMLLYDSPVQLTEDFQAEPALATVSGSGTQWTLTPREGVTFSDGSALTAEELNNSLTLAMAEGSYYRSQLTNISQHTVENNQVQITLTTADALFPNLLTFPVGKLSGSIYVGTGRYVHLSNADNSATLKRNDNYWGESASIEQVELVTLTKKDVATYSLKLGDIDCLYTEGASADIANLSTSDYPVVSNQLIFLGANGTRGDTANAALRQAISLGIDRSYLIQTALSTSAVAADSPLHPNFSQSFGETVKTRDTDGAKKLLTDAGLLSEGEELSEGKELSLTLLYCNEGADRAQTANQIAAQLAEVGITVTLDGRSEADYFSALEAGSYDLYLGEILLGDDMDLSHLWTKGTHYGYGAAPSQALLTAYQTAFSTGSGWDAFVTAFEAEYPVIPLAFRNGTFSLSRAHSLSIRAVRSNLFYNMENWQ